MVIDFRRSLERRWESQPKILRHRVMSRFFALVYAPTVIKPGYKPQKKAIVRRQPALLLLTPDPVNAWTRPIAVCHERQLTGGQISLEHTANAQLDGGGRSRQH